MVSGGFDQEVKVQISADTQPLEKGMQRAEKATKNVGKSLAKGFAIATAAIAGATVMLNKLLKTFTDYALKIDKAAKATGVAAEELQKWGYIAKQEHGNFEAMERAFLVLSQRTVQASQGLATYTREFETMGISIYNAQGQMKPANEIFMEMGDYLKTASNEAEALGHVTNLLGARQAKNLIPMLKLSNQEIARLGHEAENLGIILDDKTIKAAKKFDDAMTKAKESFKGVIYQLGAGLLPILNMLPKILTSLTPLFKKLMEILGKVLERLMPFIQELLNTFTPIIEEILDAIMPILMRALDFVLPVLIDLLKMLAPILQLITPALDLIFAVLDPILTLLEPLIDTILEPLTIGIKVLAGALEIAVGWIKKAVQWLTDLLGLTDKGARQAKELAELKAKGYKPGKAGGFGGAKIGFGKQVGIGAEAGVAGGAGGAGGTGAVGDTIEEIVTGGGGTGGKGDEDIIRVGPYAGWTLEDAIADAEEKEEDIAALGEKYLGREKSYWEQSLDLSEENLGEIKGKLEAHAQATEARMEAWANVIQQSLGFLSKTFSKFWDTLFQPFFAKLNEAQTAWGKFGASIIKDLVDTLKQIVSKILIQGLAVAAVITLLNLIPPGGIGTFLMQMLTGMSKAEAGTAAGSFGGTLKGLLGIKGSKQAGGEIEETGLHQLHKGEWVIPTRLVEVLGSLVNLPRQSITAHSLTERFDAFGSQLTQGIQGALQPAFAGGGMGERTIVVRLPDPIGAFADVYEEAPPGSKSRLGRATRKAVAQDRMAD